MRRKMKRLIGTRMKQETMDGHPLNGKCADVKIYFPNRQIALQLALHEIWSSDQEFHIGFQLAAPLTDDRGRPILCQETPPPSILSSKIWLIIKTQNFKGNDEQNVNESNLPNFQIDIQQKTNSVVCFEKKEQEYFVTDWCMCSSWTVHFIKRHA